ncbi:DUF2442 domain-containing protein [Massilioclostridium coli]|uniref:DUF2442 domain-containing protein n=1 Tax=Massilioclostridium coli TaxID=1870991 RepID=UPI00085C8F7D|nr:DUF2442 domain-containing protein [Massilioclostridium coli]
MNHSNLDYTRFFPSVLQVIPTDDYQVYAYFNDGSIRLVNIKPFIKPDTVFAPLEDIHIFKEKLAVINQTIAWDMGGNRDEQNCIDLDPIAIFKQPPVADPFAATEA